MKLKVLMTRLTDLFTIVLLASLVVLLLSYIGVIPGDMSTSGTTAFLTGRLSIALAFISGALIEIVFPIIINFERLKIKKYLVLVIAKSVLYIAAVVFLVMHMYNGLVKNTFLALVIFFILFVPQVFINLDPSLSKKVDEPEEDDDEYDEDEDEDEDEEEDDE